METNVKRIEFTKQMKQDYTILVPNMLPIHFKMIRELFKSYGYNLVVLQNEGPGVVQSGLKYVHNDTCYPALLVIGQMIDALDSGKYDTSKVALMMSQTGGGCRASNYIHLLRKALVKAGYQDIPVVSLSATGMEKNSGFKFTVPMMRRLIAAVCYGDILMLLRNQVRPYEANTGDAEAVVSKWQEYLCKRFEAGKELSIKEMKNNFNKIVDDFSNIKMTNVKKIKVGVVGEIYVKFASLGNNGLEEFLHSQSCEYMVPGLMGFILYCLENYMQDIKLYGGSRIKHFFMSRLLNFFEKIENAMIAAVKTQPRFVAPGAFTHLKDLTKGAVGLGNKMGEGWLLPAEMMELCEQGYDNIVCAQPFGCLPNHIVGKGMARTIKERFPAANITAIDYDPGAAKVNQENRIKLMLAVAKEKINVERFDRNKIPARRKAAEARTA